MRTIQRGYINNHGENLANEKLLFSHAYSFAESNSINQITVITPVFNNTGLFNRIFPKSDEKTFKDGVLINGTTITIKHISKINYLKQNITSEVILVYGIDSDGIFEIEQNSKADAIYTLPWVQGEAEKWARISQATEITTGTALPIYPIPPQGVIDTINKILGGVNICSLSSEDQKIIKEEFKKLKLSGINIDKNEIESYLYNHVSIFGCSYYFVSKFNELTKL